MKADFSKIEKYAKSLGIDLIGWAPAKSANTDADAFKNYIDEGRQGDMSYLEDYEKRLDPSALLPDAKTVIVITVNYYREQPALPAGHGRIARYAYGRDYHKVIRSLLKKLAVLIEKDHKDALVHICVDSAPLLEKSFAVEAGLGFIGKNTNLITREFGSFVLLGELITNLEFEPSSHKGLDWLKDEDPVCPACNPKPTCGTCTRCIDACPAKALIAPYKIDARKCISYLTIENKKSIPKKYQKAIGEKIFGCDICQEVCPYNKSFAKPASNSKSTDHFAEPIAGHSLPLKDIIRIKSDKEYVARFAGSPLMRAKRAGLKRNAKIALANSLSNSSQPGH